MKNPQIRFLLHHWREWAKDILMSSVAIFGVLITFADASLNVFPKDTKLHDWLYQLVHLPFDKPMTIIVLILILILIATIANWPKTKAVYKDNRSDIKVIVECCDLFDQEGLRVIHAVDTFDTALGTVISPRSVHGMFLQRAKNGNVDVDAALDAALKGIEPESEDSTLPAKTKRYPLGTVCPVNIGSDMYALTSFTHLKANGTIEIERKEYTEFLMAMWRNLASPLIRQEVVNVAVMGNRFVDLPAEFSTEQKIDLMLQTFFAVSREKSCCKTLRICVHESNLPDVDFPHYETIISHLAKRPVL